VTRGARVVERVAVHALALPAGEGTRCCLLLELHAGGLTGLGEAPAGADLVEVRAELLERQARHPAARAAWALAELDLAARAAGVPLAELLGGARRRRVRCARPLAAVSPAAVAREVETACAAGYRTFDLRAEAGGGPLDLERLGAARWAAGPAGGLRLDLHGSLAEDGERLLHSLEAFRPALVIDPVRAAGPEVWGRLVAATRTPLAASDPAAGVGLVVDPARVGGPAGALRLARAAAGPVLPRSDPVTSVGLAAALHLACALDAEPLDCALVPFGPLDADVAAGLLPGDAPWLALPDGPGLGVEVDARALARYRLDT